MKRVVAIVIDSGGVGALDDAAEYGDAPGADTIGNVARAIGGLSLPNLERLGIGHIADARGVARVGEPRARVAKLREKSRGKDTITGHWEMTGIITTVPFPTYPNGFPARGRRRVRAHRRQAAARKPNRLGNRDYRGVGAGPPRERAPDPLHVGGLGLSGGRPRGDRAAGHPLRLVRSGSGDAPPAP